MAQFHPISFMSGAPVNLSDTLSAYNAREFHHIYPKAYLAARGIQFHEANVIANICMLSSTDNKAISDSKPEDYFNQVPPNIKTEAFNKALIEQPFWDGTKLYADFVQARAVRLSMAASALIASA